MITNVNVETVTMDLSVVEISGSRKRGLNLDLCLAPPNAHENPETQNVETRNLEIQNPNPHGGSTSAEILISSADDFVDTERNKRRRSTWAGPEGGFMAMLREADNYCPVTVQALPSAPVMIPTPPSPVVISAPPAPVVVPTPPASVMVPTPPASVMVPTPPAPVMAPPAPVMIPTPPSSVAVPTPPAVVPTPPTRVVVPAPPAPVVIPDPPAPVVVGNLTCPVCIGPFTEEMTTRCGHIFCRECIMRSLSVKSACPTCRKKVTKRGLIRVFLPVPSSM